MSRYFLLESFNIFIQGIHISFQMMRAVYRIRKLKMPIITIFGGREELHEGVYYKVAYELAKKLAQEGVSTLTGGGPGIMLAANCGSKDGKPQDQKQENTLGIAVRGIDDEFENACSELLAVDNFFLRKWLMIRYALGIVVFPGGLGTVDELFEVLNFMKHQRIPSIPIILFGTAYWGPIAAWMKDQALPAGYIHASYLDFIIVTDDLNQVLEQLRYACNQYDA